MIHRLRCQCGAIRGHVALPAKTVRAICYCRDCQAFARYLARAGDVLDEHGGTDIVATPLPACLYPPPEFSGGTRAVVEQYDDNPFFDPVSGGPIKQPRVLSEAEASALKSAV